MPFGVVNNSSTLGEQPPLEKELTPGTDKRYVPPLWRGFDFLHWRLICKPLRKNRIAWPPKNFPT